MKSVLTKLLFVSAHLLVSALSFDYFHRHISRYILPVLQKHYNYFAGDEVINKLGLFKTWYYEVYYGFIKFLNLPFDELFSMMAFVLILKGAVLVFVVQIPQITWLQKFFLALFVAVGSDGFIGSDYVFPNANYHALLAHCLIFSGMIYWAFSLKKTVLPLILIALLYGLAIFFHGISFLLSLPFLVLFIYLNRETSWSFKILTIGIQLVFVLVYKVYLGDTVFNNPETAAQAKDVFLHIKGDMVHNSLHQSAMEWVFFLALIIVSVGFLYRRTKDHIFIFMYAFIILGFVGAQWFADISDNFTLNYLQLMRFSIWAKTALFIWVVAVSKEWNLWKLALIGLFLVGGYLFMLISIFMAVKYLTDWRKTKSKFLRPSKLIQWFPISAVSLFYIALLLLAHYTPYVNMKAVLSASTLIAILFLIVLSIAENQMRGLKGWPALMLLITAASPTIIDTRNAKISDSAIHNAEPNSWTYLRFNKEKGVVYEGAPPSALVWVDPVFYKEKVEQP